MLGQIMFAGVANNEHDDRVLVECARNAQRGGEVRSRRSAAEDAFYSAQLSRHLKRLAIRDVDYLVDVLDLRVGRNDLLPDSCHEVRSRFDEVSRLFERLKDRTIWIRA